jgi:hypothetical protein
VSSGKEIGVRLERSAERGLGLLDRAAPEEEVTPFGLGLRTRRIHSRGEGERRLGFGDLALEHEQAAVDVRRPRRRRVDAERVVAPRPRHVEVARVEREERESREPERGAREIARQRFVDFSRSLRKAATADRVGEQEPSLGVVGSSVDDLVEELPRASVPAGIEGGLRLFQHLGRVGRGYSRPVVLVDLVLGRLALGLQARFRVPSSRRLDREGVAVVAAAAAGRPDGGGRDEQDSEPSGHSGDYRNADMAPYRAEVDGRERKRTSPSRSRSACGASARRVP